MVFCLLVVYCLSYVFFRVSWFFVSKISCGVVCTCVCICVKVEESGIFCLL